jgi:TonB family protein
MATQTPTTRTLPQRSPQQTSVLSGVTALKKYDGTSIFPTMFIWSMVGHLALVAVGALLVFLLQFLGFHIPLFDTAQLPEKDIEFTLVDVDKDEKPLNPTKLRSTKNSRAGGQAVPNRVKAQTIRAAGAPAQTKPGASANTPAQRPQRTSPPPGPRVAQQQRPQRQAVQRPQQSSPAPKQVTRTQPKPQQQPAPQAPLPPSRNPQIAEAPSPTAPKIRLPGAPKASAPKAIATGPVAPTYTPNSGNGTQGEGGQVGPSQLPGALSGGGGSGRQGQAGSPGGARGGRAGSGGGGRGQYEQYGSPGGGRGRDGVDAIAAPDYGAYMSELQRRIKRNWHPPQAQEDKRVVVNFSIDRQGRLLRVSLGRPSGNPDADQAAITAVRMSAPFRALPAGHPDNDLAIQFTFDYNVYRGGTGGFSYR